MSQYLEGLNEPQRQAVLHTKGPLMIIAGAGSGKTRVLTYRIAHLIAQGVEPFSILSLTFTNKAAREMRERIERVIGKEAKNIWMGTFHSIFAKILRFEADKIGYQSNFTIYDTDDSKSVIKGILKDLQLDDKVYKPSAVLHRISMAKNNLISWKAYAQNPEFIMEDEAARRPKTAEIFKLYADRCFKANAMDFDDLLYNTNVLFRDHLDVLNKYQHRFNHVMIDEFQDTNLSQYSITRKLASVHQNIAVVGDDAQSIYAFRGANIQNILNFQKDYPDLVTVKLEQNYRSTKNIVEAANSVIRYNQRQLQKKVWTANEQGGRIQLIKATSDMEEGRLVATSIFQHKMQNSLPNKAFAVLYRTNSQSRAIEEALRSMNIKYKIIGGLSFYQRKEIKDLIAYLRFTINPNDMEAFKRIVNYPKRGIGDSTVDKVEVAANDHGMTPWEVMINAEHFFGKNRITNALSEFAGMMRAFQLAVAEKDAFTAATQVAKNSGILKELYEDKTPEGRVRYDNLQELLNSIKAFVDNPENEDKSMASFLQEVSLYSTSEENNDEDSVTLMTIHMSKGLEFEYVYLVGMEEDLFPSQMMLNSREDLEEERRLFYVAITRAKKQLALSYALQRYRYGQLKPCEPSRFVEEVPAEFLDTSRTVSNGFAEQQGSFGNIRRGRPDKPTPVSELGQKPAAAAGKPHVASPNFKPTEAGLLKVGQKVEHQKFGFGVIEHIEQYGNDRRARIKFETAGEKTLILSFAKLMVCS